MSLRGVIFDLDGTLVDSRLDFAAVRGEMGLTDGQPILEAIAALPAGPRKTECLAILREHELRGARAATLMPGAGELLDDLTHRGLLQGVLTRNSPESTEIALGRLGLRFSQVVTREDVPPKPHPAGLLRICRAWNVAVDDVLFIGDFLFDLQAGKNAGIRTVLYAPDDLPDYAAEANFTIRNFFDAVSLIARLDGADCEP